MAGWTFHDGYFAHDTNHFVSIAVANTPAIEFTIFQRCLITHAIDFVHLENTFTRRRHIRIWWIE